MSIRATEVGLLSEGRSVPFSLQLSAGSDACGREMWHTQGGSIFSVICKGRLDREILQSWQCQLRIPAVSVQGALCCSSVSKCSWQDVCAPDFVAQLKKEKVQPTKRSWGSWKSLFSYRRKGVYAILTWCHVNKTLPSIDCSCLVCSCFTRLHKWQLFHK